MNPRAPIKPVHFFHRKSDLGFAFFPSCFRGAKPLETSLRGGFEPAAQRPGTRPPIHTRASRRVRDTRLTRVRQDNVNQSAS